MKPQHLSLKSGGKVTEISAVGHETDEGVAWWFYVGSVEFSPTSKRENFKIEPWALCIDEDTEEARAEIATASGYLSDYLREAGRWHKAKHMKDGRVVHWTPHAKVGSRSLPAESMT